MVSLWLWASKSQRVTTAICARVKLGAKLHANLKFVIAHTMVKDYSLGNQFPKETTAISAHVKQTAKLFVGLKFVLAYTMVRH